MRYSRKKPIRAVYDKPYVNRRGKLPWVQSIPIYEARFNEKGEPVLNESGAIVYTNKVIGYTYIYHSNKQSNKF